MEIDKEKLKKTFIKLKKEILEEVDKRINSINNIKDIKVVEKKLVNRVKRKFGRQTDEVKIGITKAIEEGDLCTTDLKTLILEKFVISEATFFRCLRDLKIQEVLTWRVIGNNQKIYSINKKLLEK